MKVKVDESVASTLGCSLLSHALQGLFLLMWPPDPLVLLCSLCKFLLVWVCCYCNLKMETKLWRGESVGGALKLPVPLVLMQQVPVQVSWISSTVPIAPISSAPEALQSRTSLMCPSKQNATATFSLQCCLFPKTAAVEKQILRVVLTPTSQIGPIQGWEACMDCGSLLGRKS